MDTIAQFRREDTAESLSDRGTLRKKDLQKVVEFLGVDEGRKARRFNNVTKQHRHEPALTGEFSPFNVTLDVRT
jgi:hypothetical protein